MGKTLTTEELERIYDLLAETLNTIGPDKESLFLSKLALLLAEHLGDEGKVRECIEIAGKDLT